MWLATPEELNADLSRLAAPATRALGQHHTEYRIAFHDASQEAVKIITPSARFMRALMAGNIVRHVRVSHDDPETGLPVLEGTGELMPPMTEREAIDFVAWKDVPRGVNHFEIITTDDLPRVNGSIDAARKFRNTWSLQ